LDVAREWHDGREANGDERVAGSVRLSLPDVEVDQHSMSHPLRVMTAPSLDGTVMAGGSQGGVQAHG
jgi:hypothetical protein